VTSPAPGGSTLRLLHTSDIHIEEAQDAGHVRALAGLAIARAADALLIVGDFFDHNRVSDETLKAVADALDLVPGPVVVLPGNHDPAVPGSPYARADLGARVHVLTAAGGETVELPELDLAVWGRPHASYDDFRPLAAVPTRGAARWQVGLAHGHLVRDGRDRGRAYPIDPAEIAAADRDYIALGHWDVAADASSGGSVAAYSGSPSRLGVCALVTLSIDGAGARSVTVERLAVDPASA
jgi:DNA repair exonuclease SbcCD nuclease subunit